MASLIYLALVQGVCCAEKICCVEGVCCAEGVCCNCADGILCGCVLCGECFTVKRLFLLIFNDKSGLLGPQEFNPEKISVEQNSPTYLMLINLIDSYF